MNKQITEDYVSYEIAKLLKEKGFDESVNRFYELSTGEPIMVRTEFTRNSYTTSFACSTHQMALKWLREVHRIFISIMCCTYPTLNKITWIPDITTFESVFPDSAVECNSYEQAIETALLYVLKNLI